MMFSTALAPAGAAQAVGAREEVEVLGDGRVRVDAGVVGHEARDPPHLLRMVHDRVAADARIAALRRVERRQDPHRRRLAGAVRPDEAEHLAALDAERHVVHRVDAVEVADQPVELEHRRRSWLPLGPAEHEVEAAALVDAA